VTTIRRRPFIPTNSAGGPCTACLRASTWTTGRVVSALYFMLSVRVFVAHVCHVESKGRPMTQAIGRSATSHSAGIQPDTDARGRDRYSERDEDLTARGFPGTFVTRDKIEAGIVARDGALTMIDPRPYASLLYDGAGMPVLSPQMLTYLAGPDPQRGAVKRLITALQALKDRDERAYGMLCARFDEGHSYARIGVDFGVCRSTAHATILRCVEALTDWLDTRAAMDLEQAALEAGSLDDDAEHLAPEARAAVIPAPTQGQEQALPLVDASPAPDKAGSAPTSLDAYWRAVERRRVRDAYERGA